MNNEYTIDINEILTQDTHSITDAETIRQIALLMIEVDDITSQQLSSKIKPSMQFCGLYPDIIEDYSHLLLDDKEKIDYQFNTYCVWSRFDMKFSQYGLYNKDGNPITFSQHKTEKEAEDMSDSIKLYGCYDDDTCKNYDAINVYIKKVKKNV